MWYKFMFKVLDRNLAEFDFLISQATNIETECIKEEKNLWSYVRMSAVTKNILTGEF